MKHVVSGCAVVSLLVLSSTVLCEVPSPYATGGDVASLRGRGPKLREGNGVTLTLCEQCVFDYITAMKDRTTLDPVNCTQAKPRMLENFKCAKYNCQDKVYWSFLHQSWGSCTDVVDTDACDTSTCTY